MITVPFSDGSGVLHRYTDLPSPTGDLRTVDVWLPASALQANEQRYPVLYMHDGQNLFDSALAYGGVDWGMDEAMQRLIARGLSGAIVVGAWNSGEGRWHDYMPQTSAWISQLPEEHRHKFRSNNYLRFLVNVVKPLIDATYPTLPDRAHTFVMGSSMGGLISLYALEQYPHIFGGAGCLSTHWPAGQAALVDAMAANLPAPGQHKLYFDYGTEALDALYEPFQLRMDTHLTAAGYTRDQDWITLKFDGAEHNEVSWRARVDIPLLFLLNEASAN